MIDFSGEFAAVDSTRNVSTAKFAIVFTFDVQTASRLVPRE